MFPREAHPEATVDCQRSAASGGRKIALHVHYRVSGLYETLIECKTRNKALRIQFSFVIYYASTKKRI